MYGLRRDSRTKTWRRKWCCTYCTMWRWSSYDCEMSFWVCVSLSLCNSECLLNDYHGKSRRKGFYSYVLCVWLLGCLTERERVVLSGGALWLVKKSLNCLKAPHETVLKIHQNLIIREKENPLKSIVCSHEKIINWTSTARDLKA